MPKTTIELSIISPAIKKFRKLPVEIYAFRYNPNTQNEDDLYKFFSDLISVSPNPHRSAIGVFQVDVYDKSLYIFTMEGKMKANPGDYIIMGVDGEFYPCNPDIFAKTYEPAQ